MPPKFLENMVLLCFERRLSKQNSVIRLKSSILAPPKFLAPQKFLSWLRHCGWIHKYLQIKKKTYFKYCWSESGAHCNGGLQKAEVWWRNWSRGNRYFAL